MWDWRLTRQRQQDFSSFCCATVVRRTSIWLVLITLASLSASLKADETDDAVNKAKREQQRIESIAAAAPTVVCVMPPDGQGGGSGVLISADGYAVSNFHVTSGAGPFLKCGLNDGRVYDAVIVGVDPTGDVSLIKLLGRDDFPFCTPGDSDRVKTGDEVLALGNPFLLAADFTPTVTYGIVSGVHRYQYPADTFLEYTDCIQIDASINPGNSGGPLFDIHGRWIGINGRASFEKRGRVNTGAAYAISVRQVLLFVDHLKSGRIVDHGRTGFTVTTDDGLARVEEISELSEAWRRGLRVGDEIVSFAGRAVSGANDFKNILGIFPAATRVRLAYRNDEGVQRVTVRLESLHDSTEQLPGMSAPKPHSPQPDETPDDHPDANDEDKVHSPAEYAHLYEEKSGFTNFYFNRINTNRFVKPLKAALSGSSATNDATWIVRGVVRLNGVEQTGELTVGKSAAGLDFAGLEPQLQSSDELDAANEPTSYYGILAGLLQWYRLCQDTPEPFADLTYFGSERLLPSEQFRHVLVGRNGVATMRWYFDETSPLPAGMDIRISSGADEGRLRFEDWQDSHGRPFPGRIGVVNNNDESIDWIEIDSIDVRPVSSTGAKADSENKERS